MERESLPRPGEVERTRWRQGIKNKTGFPGYMRDGERSQKERGQTKREKEASKARKERGDLGEMESDVR